MLHFKWMRNFEESSMRFIVYLVFSCFIFSCTTNEHPPIAFYYWKQQFSLEKIQKKLLKDLNSNKIYVKYFDVVLENMDKHAKPIALIDFKSLPNQEVVPCVYIQNNVFKFTENQKGLALKVSKLVNQISKRQSIRVKEIQLDCDWTNTTQSHYFHFLKELKILQPTTIISSTIRLHQLKYPKETGIPPVEKGVLMCYNMDDIDRFETPNSIISTDVLAQYVTENTSYDLPLDLALPVYQWGLVFRLGKLSLIANDITNKDVANSNFKKVTKNIYQVLNNHYLYGNYVCKGDLIRLEKSSPKVIKSAINILNSSDLTFNQLILYHISQEHLNQYNEAFFKQINRTIP